MFQYQENFFIFGGQSETSIRFYIEPAKNKDFNGVNPSIFYLSALPSVTHNLGLFH